MALRRKQFREPGMRMRGTLEVISVGELRPLDLGSLLTRGVAAGLVAGVVFLLAHMWFSVSRGLPALSPLYVMATVFDGASVPMRTPDGAVLGRTPLGATDRPRPP